MFSIAVAASDSTCVASFDVRASVDTSGFCTGISSEFSVPCAICTSTARLRKLWKVKSLILIRLTEYVKTATASMNDCYTRYLPSTANSRCSKNMFFCSSDRATSPDSSPWRNSEKGKRKTPRVDTFSRTQRSFQGLENPFAVLTKSENSFFLVESCSAPSLPYPSLPDYRRFCLCHIW